MNSRDLLLVETSDKHAPRSLQANVLQTSQVTRSYRMIPPGPTCVNMAAGPGWPEFYDHENFCLPPKTRIPTHVSHFGENSDHAANCPKVLLPSFSQLESCSLGRGLQEYAYTKHYRLEHPQQNQGQPMHYDPRFELPMIKIEPYSTSTDNSYHSIYQQHQQQHQQQQQHYIASQLTSLAQSMSPAKSQCTAEISPRAQQADKLEDVEHDPQVAAEDTASAVTRSLRTKTLIPRGPTFSRSTVKRGASKPMMSAVEWVAISKGVPHLQNDKYDEENDIKDVALKNSLANLRKLLQEESLPRGGSNLIRAYMIGKELMLSREALEKNRCELAKKRSTTKTRIPSGLAGFLARRPFPKMLVRSGSRGPARNHWRLNDFAERCLKVYCVLRHLKSEDRVEKLSIKPRAVADLYRSLKSTREVCKLICQRALDHGDLLMNDCPRELANLKHEDIVSDEEHPESFTESELSD